MRLSELLPLRVGRLAVGVCLVALALISEFHRADDPSFTPLDRVLYDTRMAWHPIRPSSQVLIVDIDARSLAEQGDWPWPQDKIGPLYHSYAADELTRLDAHDPAYEQT